MKPLLVQEGLWKLLCYVYCFYCSQTTAVRAQVSFLLLVQLFALLVSQETTAVRAHVLFLLLVQSDLLLLLFQAP